MTKTNSWKLTQYVIRNVEEEPSAKLVMLSLASYVRENWTTSVAISTLVKETGLSRSTVRRVLKQLEDDEVIYRMGPGKQHHSTTYIIAEPVGFADWNAQMFSKRESQRVHGERQRVHGDSQRVHGEPLVENKKIKEEATGENLTVDKALVGPARRDALKAARLIARRTSPQ